MFREGPTCFGFNHGMSFSLTLYPPGSAVVAMSKVGMSLNGGSNLPGQVLCPCKNALSAVGTTLA
jgi:hypothetical protein